MYLADGVSVPVFNLLFNGEKTVYYSLPIREALPKEYYIGKCEDVPFRTEGRTVEEVNILWTDYLNFLAGNPGILECFGECLSYFDGDFEGMFVQYLNRGRLFFKDIDSAVELGRYILSVGNVGKYLDKELEEFFDFEAYGKVLLSSGNYCLVSGGALALR